MNVASRRLAVVDTDVFSLLYVRSESADPRVPDWRTRLTGRRVLITFQTRAELLALASVNGWGDRRELDLRAQLARTATIGVDDTVVESYAALVAECRRIGHPLHQKHHTADRWIAACAIAKDVDLLAGDTVFDGAPGLRLVKVDGDD